MIIKMIRIIMKKKVYSVNKKKNEIVDFPLEFGFNEIPVSCTYNGFFFTFDPKK